MKFQHQQAPRPHPAANNRKVNLTAHFNQSLNSVHPKKHSFLDSAVAFELMWGDRTPHLVWTHLIDHCFSQAQQVSAEHTDPTLITELWRSGQCCLALPKTRLWFYTGHTHQPKRNPPPTPLHLRESHHLHIQNSRKPSVLAEDRRQQIPL